MKSHSSLDTLLWSIKYVGVPVTLGITMFGLCSHFSRKKRRAALQGKVVVITGASSGIGEALAHAFYQQGSKVVLAARRIPELERVKQDLMSINLPLPTQEPVVIELDLDNIGSLEEFAEKVYDQCGEIDVLINNGGVSHRGSILDTKFEVDQRIMSINYFGSVALTKAVLPRMVKRRSGHILFVSSVQGLIAIPDRSAYAATKHAMQAFGDCLRAEMHQHNINVTVISPGYIKTNISLNAYTGSGESHGVQGLIAIPDRSAYAATKHAMQAFGDCLRAEMHQHNINVTVISPGYIKTNISLNAYTGSGESHGVMDKSTAAGFTTEYTANKILDTVVYKKDELIVSQFIPRLAIFLRHATPSIYFWAMNKRANKTALSE